MARKTAREAVFLLLYEWTLGGGSEDGFETFIRPELDGNLNEDDLRYIGNITRGVMEHCDALDEKIGRFSVGWKTERMARVDLTILRMASYEIIYRDDIPDAVAVNEAVELCGRYSNDDAGSFVNGVLGNLARGKDND